MVHDVHTIANWHFSSELWNYFFFLSTSATQIPKHADIFSKGSFIFTMHRERVVVVVGKDTQQCTQIVAVLSIYSSLLFLPPTFRSRLQIATPKDWNRFHGKYLQCLYVWDHRSTTACSNLQRNNCTFHFFSLFFIAACCPSFFYRLSFFLFSLVVFFVTLDYNILHIRWHKFKTASH